MPLLLGTKENDIMKWRACADLAATLKGSLSGKWAGSSVREAESFLGKFIDSLQEELRFEARAVGELSALDEAIAAASSTGELPRLQMGYGEVVSAHFERRQSVLAFCDACNALHDRVLAKILSLLEKQLPQTGPALPNWALLTAGNRGRGEQTLRGENQYLLLCDRPTAAFLPFLASLTDALKHAGLLESEQRLWHGTLQDWQALLDAGLHPAEQRELPIPLPFQMPQPEPQRPPEREWRLEALTDLLFLHGDEPLAGRALKAAKLTLEAERKLDPFFQLSRRVLSLPLAVGHFGRWRLQRSGEHRGELNLEELALGPLVMTVRVLAVHAEIDSRGTVDRIRELLAKGALDVELAERLLKAYQCFMQLKIQHQMDGKGSGSFCNPGAFDEGEEARFRNSIAAVFSLQKIGYQRMVGQG